MLGEQRTAALRVVCSDTRAGAFSSGAVLTEPQTVRFRTRGSISAGVVEGFNNKAKLTMRKSYGFPSYQLIKIALLHSLGALPEPNFTHRFC